MRLYKNKFTKEVRSLPIGVVTCHGRIQVPFDDGDVILGVSRLGVASL